MTAGGCGLYIINRLPKLFCDFKNHSPHSDSDHIHNLDQTPYKSWYPKHVSAKLLINVKGKELIQNKKLTYCIIVR